MNTHSVYMASLDEETIGVSPNLIVAETKETPFLYVIPSHDGTTLYIQTERMAEVAGDLVLETSLANGGPHTPGSWTGTYSDTIQAYVIPIPGFSPELDINGTINLTSTTGINTGHESIHRSVIDVSEEGRVINSENGHFELVLNASETLPFDAYVATHTHQSGAVPESLPDDVELIGYVYSVIVSGSSLTSAKPMTLRLYYTTETLAGHDSETLSIMKWDSQNNVWKEMDSQLWPTEQYVSTTTDAFTGYALVAKPAAIDVFFDDFEYGFRHTDFLMFDNLTTIRDTMNNSDFLVTLDNPSASGYMATKPIALTENAQEWGRITYEGTGSFVVDVLDADGNALMTNVTSGTSLATIDHTTHPSIRLKVSMTANDQQLDWWQISSRIGDVCIAGDINCDGIVNRSDLDLLRASFAKCDGQTGYNADADLNNDTCVNVGDFGILRQNYGQSRP
ncbi:MAG: dockerin type I repeat-containing protein [Chloroflexota bacterium]